MRVTGPTPLRGALRVPGDKSISHRVLLLGAVAEGTSTVRGLSDGEDVAHTRLALEAMGVPVEPLGDEPGAWTVEGGHLSAPSAPLDMGNSGTGLRLTAGLVAGHPWRTELTGDDSLRLRPMDRIAVPLGLMGAIVTGQGERALPPLVVEGGGLTGITYEPPMASAQVKSAVLLAGLAADGPTTVVEAVPTRSHTEDLLADMGADVQVEDGAVTLTPGRPLAPLDVDVPGDPSQAAFWVVAALLCPESDVTVEHVHLGPGRDGFLAVLEAMGADLEVARGDAGVGSVRARTSRLVGAEVPAEAIAGLVDEVPVLAVAAATAEGPTRFCDAGELRAKESDRLATTVALLAAFGAEATIEGDDLVVAGGATLRPGRVDAAGDHRIAMAGAVAGAAGDGETVVDGWHAVPTSYPGFAADLDRLAGVEQ